MYLEPWDDEELKTLHEMHAAGATYDAIADALPKRTAKGVGQKARSLGLRYLASPSEPWNQQELDTLREMWEWGVSAAEIAKALPGRSRNSVIGKVHRLKMGGQPTPKQIAARKKWHSEVMSRTANRLVAEGRYSLPRAESASKSEPKQKPVLMEVKPMVESLRVGLQDITADQCHWPTNDDMRNVEFCGHAVKPLQGRPFYCAHHQWISSPRSEIKCDAPPTPSKNSPAPAMLVA